MTKEIAENSYVTDLFRVVNGHGSLDLDRSKQLILEEIEVLVPEVIVLIGSDVKKSFEPELETQPEKFIYIPHLFRESQEPIELLGNQGRSQSAI